jgi:hypothetical protein
MHEGIVCEAALFPEAAVLDKLGAEALAGGAYRPLEVAGALGDDGVGVVGETPHAGLMVAAQDEVGAEVGEEEEPLAEVGVEVAAFVAGPLGSRSEGGGVEEVPQVDGEVRAEVGLEAEHGIEGRGIREVSVRATDGEEAFQLSGGGGHEDSGSRGESLRRLAAVMVAQRQRAARKKRKRKKSGMARGVTGCRQSARGGAQTRWLSPGSGLRGKL